MVTQRKPKASKYLTTPTRPVQVDRDRSVAGLLEKMEGTGFGGRQLAEAHRIWLDMLGDNTTIMVTGSGALIPAGMRRLLAYVIKNRFVDVLVLSGSMLFHDLHETLDNIVNLVAKRMGVEVCSIYLLEDDGETLRLQASKGLSRSSVGKVTMKTSE